MNYRIIEYNYAIFLARCQEMCNVTTLAIHSYASDFSIPKPQTTISNHIFLCAITKGTEKSINDKVY